MKASKIKDVYILGAEQISVQSPLTEDWMDHPIAYNEGDIRAIDPDYKQYFGPNVARRLDRILKRAMLTSRKLMETTGISNPDAIIAGSGLGCIENTELFLEALINDGEEMLKPTYFMQSTHNTIASLIAIDTHCRGYNSTYTHKGISFECALLDACMQLENNEIQTALVGAYDEMTDHYFIILKRGGYLGRANGFSGETAVGLMLGTERKANALCRINDVEMYYRPDKDELQRLFLQFLQKNRCDMESVDAVMIGNNGWEANDRVYEEICPFLFPDKKLLHYKHLFGESYTAPGLGVYAAATCLHRQRIPSHLFVCPEKEEQRGIKRLLFYNQFENKNHSFILLSQCGE